MYYQLTDRRKPKLRNQPPFNLRDFVWFFRYISRDKDSHEVVFFISSLPVLLTWLAKYLRGHWGIENSLHWSLDVTFGEHKS